MKGIILFGHGSRSAGYAQPFDRIRAAMRARAPEALIESGFLEFTRPTLDESIDHLAGCGVTEIVVVPIFIGAGRHVLKDLPQLAANAMDRHPDLEITLAAPVGEAPDVVDAMAAYALDAG